MKSELSVSWYNSSMNRTACPLPSSGISASSKTMPCFINRQPTEIGVTPGLRMAAPVLIPPTWRRTGKTASWTG